VSYTLYATNFLPEWGDWTALWFDESIGNWVGAPEGWVAQNQPVTIIPPDISNHSLWIWPAGTSIDNICALDNGIVTVDQQTLELTGDLCVDTTPTSLIFAHIPRVAMPGDNVECEFLIKNGEPTADDVAIMPVIQTIGGSLTISIEGSFHYYKQGEYKWVKGSFVMPDSTLQWRVVLYVWDWDLSEWIETYTLEYIPDPVVVNGTHDTAGRTIVTEPQSGARPECWIAFVCYSNNGYFPSGDIEKNVDRVVNFWKTLMPYFDIYHTLTYSEQRDVVMYNTTGATFPDIYAIDYDLVPKAHIFVPLWDAEGNPAMFGGSYGIDVVENACGRQMSFNATSYNTGWNEMQEPGDGIISNFYQTIIHECFHGFHSWADHLGYCDDAYPTCGYWCCGYSICPWCYDGEYYKEIAGEWWYQKMYNGLYRQYTKNIVDAWLAPPPPAEFNNLEVAQYV